MNKPRVLILENSVVMTGALKAIITSSKSLRPFFSFQFVIPKGSITGKWIGQANFDGIYFWRITEINKRAIALLMYLPRLIVNGFRLKRFVRRQNIDLIHVNDLYNLIPAVATLFGCRTPYVCHVRFMPGGFPPMLFNFWLAAHLRYAKKIVVVSNALMNSLPASDKIEVVYNGAVFDELPPPEDPEQHTHIFLYLANVIPGKGHDLALEAFARVHDQIPGWKLRFVGGDNGLKKNRKYFLSLKQKAIEYRLSDKVEWKEFIEDVQSEYKAADVILNFSESESFSMTSLEALSMGRPLIVTDCGGPAEIVDHEVSGFLVPNRDVGAMADAILKLAHAPALRVEMGRKGAEQMRARFDAGINSKKLMAVYRYCLDSI
jgi:glycosyltransferase involved in cell wall biosynthesis